LTGWLRNNLGNHFFSPDFRGRKRVKSQGHLKSDDVRFFLELESRWHFPQVEWGNSPKAKLDQNVKPIGPESDATVAASRVNALRQATLSSFRHERHEVEEVRLSSIVGTDQNRQRRKVQFDLPETAKSLDFNVVKHAIPLGTASDQSIAIIATSGTQYSLELTNENCVPGIP
jgi:hypothetical protein